MNVNETVKSKDKAKFNKHFVKTIFMHFISNL